MLRTEARRYPSLRALGEALGGVTGVMPVPIPLECTDGFSEAYYGRPERLFALAARLSCSAWSFPDPDVQDRFTDHLGRDLTSGGWDRRHRYPRQLPFHNGSLRLVVSRP